MNYDKRDNEELLHLSLDAINGGRDADAVVMLKTLLEREPGNAHGQYLLAAQHAQLGMYGSSQPVDLAWEKVGKPQARR